MADALRKVINGVRYTFAGMRLLFTRLDLSTDETMQEINMLRRKYGLKEWDL